MEQLRKAIQIVGSAVGSMLNFEQRKQILKRKLDELESREIDINIELEHSEASSGKKRRNEVENWLVNVARIQNEVRSIEEKVGISRWSTALGSRLENMTEEVARLIDKGRFEGGLLLDAHNIEEDLLLTTKMVGQKFQRNMDEILACLTNDEISRIGIYGMGGVGKTTLVTHIHNRIKENPNTFGSAYWVTMSQEFSIYRLQSLIANTLKIDISKEDDEKKRAAKLSKILGSNHKCILILDDLWKHFCLEEVGIPVQIGGCKLILTSRSVEVCRRMDCKVQIKVETLSEEEAWNLFMEKLGREMPLPPEINKIAKSIVRECDGLPLGIITVAGSMRGEDEVCVWRTALRELQESEIMQDDMEDKVFRVLRFSFNRLKDPALEKCFLFCALFPEDFEIRRGKLIDYFIFEGIIKQMNKRQDQCDKGHAMLNKLENVCLLEGVDYHGIKYVKMHDLIRDMALQIMKSGPHTAMVESGKQWKEIPKPDHEGRYWNENVVWVSFYDNHIREIPSRHSPRCPNLRTLLLLENFLETIADSFFTYLHGLKIVDISKTGIRKLPDSIASLENLTALLVEHCPNLTHVPSLANLKSLKKLDLRFTSLKEIPEGLEFLNNLTYLNLLCTGIAHFPCGILPKLCHLQYFGWSSTSSETSKVVVEELACLQKLETLIIGFKDFGDYNSYVLLLSRTDSGIERQQLTKHHLVVGSQWGKFESQIMHYDLNFNFRKVEFEGNIISEEIQVPSTTQNLSFYGDCIREGRGLCLKNAVELKSLRIEKCETSAWLFDLSSSLHIFPSLEIVDLLNLQKLRALFNREEDARQPPTALSPTGAFSNLKSFKMEECHNMKKLFHPAMIRNLQNLEELRVIICSEMEEIIAAEASDYNSSDNPTDEFILPKLRLLTLNFLPKLKNISSRKMICNNLQEIEIGYCEKLQNIPISCPLQSLQELQLRLHPKEWRESVEWEHAIDKTVLQHL